MPFKYNPFIDNLDYYVNRFLGVLGSAPASPNVGDTYINSGDSGYYVYYGGSWELIKTLTPATLSYFLLESGDFFLLETGDKLALEA